MKIKMIKHEKKYRRKIKDYVERMGMFNLRHTGQWFPFSRESADTFLYWLL
jgi:hypothetical protein